MNSRVERKTVDLSPFPDLVVIYLGMRVNALTGVKTLFGFGPQIKNSVKDDLASRFKCPQRPQFVPAPANSSTFCVRPPPPVHHTPGVNRGS